MAKTYLQVTPVPGKWYVSDRFQANSLRWQIIDPTQPRPKRATSEMILAGPFDTRDLAARWNTLTGTFGYILGKRDRGGVAGVTQPVMARCNSPASSSARIGSCSSLLQVTPTIAPIASRDRSCPASTITPSGQSILSRTSSSPTSRTVTVMSPVCKDWPSARLNIRINDSPDFTAVDAATSATDFH